MNTCVLIPSARADNLVACVTALRAKNPDLPPERIIVVDDGARPGAEARLPHLTWVQGEKPFIFARNVNLGLRACPGDVILLNDDALLLTTRGFDAWTELMHEHPEIGVCSCGVQGAVGNPRQRALAHGRLVMETSDLAFVCVYLPRTTLETVGPFDERFTGYGYEDNDYCERVRYHGMKLAVWHGCVVQHDGHLPSSFRTKQTYAALLARNRRLFAQKYAPTTPAPTPVATTTAAAPPRRVDIMYVAWNRLAFTQESFANLVANTNWEHVHELVVYDDGSQDGTREWLEEHIREVPVPHRLKRTSFGSPVAAMGDFIAGSRAAILAKLDNDAVVPPGWLAESLRVLDRHPELGLLGIEAMYPHETAPAGPRGYVPAQFIGGLGLFRRQAFARSRPAARRKYFGFGEWQVAQGKNLVRGWLKPAVPVFLLDRLPFAPWVDHSREYVRRGWQRDWPGYARDCALWHWRWPETATAGEAAPAIVDPPHETIDAPPDEPAVTGTKATRINLRWEGPEVAGFINVDIVAPELPGHVDLRLPWPWTTDSVDAIRAVDVLEHFREKIHLMNELWRVLRPGGTVAISVPTTDGPGAFQDPTHVSYWHRRSFLYFEDGNPYRERHAARYGITARFRVVRERLVATADGPRLDITLEAAKGSAPPPAAPRVAVRIAPAPSPTTPPGPGFVAALRVKNEAAHLHEVIAAALPLCEHVFLFDDHSTDDTVAIARSFGDCCTVMSSPFEGLDEARDKNALLARVLAADPGWVLWIDGDEVLEAGGPAALRRAAAVPGIAAYSLRIAYLWDDAAQVRIDGIYGRAARPSFFRVRGQDGARLAFATTGRGGNFHCGNVPRGLRGTTRPLAVRLKHYGYQSAVQRERKYRWYTRLDPDNQAEDHYRHLAGIRGARLAPGPPVLVPWRE